MLDFSLLERCVSSRSFAQAEPVVRDVIDRDYPSLESPVLDLSAVHGSEKLNGLFQRACYCSQELSDNSPCIAELKERALSLFQETLITYQNDLLPLLMRSLQCHQTALSQFSMGQRKAACQTMGEIREIAERLKPIYEALIHQWEPLSESMGQLFIAMQGEGNSALMQSKELPEPTHILLKTRASALKISCNSLWEINSVFHNIRAIWACADPTNFTDSNLADPAMVEMMESEEGKESDARWMTEIETSFGCTPQKIESCNGSSFSLPGGTVENRSFLKRIRAEIGGGVREVFERSCSKWLALGLVSQKIARLVDKVFD